MNKPKKHHFNPRLSLQHFAGNEPSGHVWTYEKYTGVVRSAIPEETAVENHFYSVQKESGEMDTGIEAHLARVESDAAPTYERLLNDQLPETEQRKLDFSNFVALGFTRTHTMRRIYAEIMSRGHQIKMYASAANSEAFERLIQSYSQETGEEITDELKAEVRRHLLDQEGYTVEVSRQSTIRALGAADGLAPLFFKMNWSVVHAEHGYFITSDNPVTRDSDPKSRHPIYGDGGFVNKTVEVKYPLSPKRLLFMTWHAGPGMGYKMNRQLVDLMNSGTAARSDRFVYAHVKDKRIERLAERHKDSRQKVSIQGFGPKQFAETRIVRRISADD